MNKIIGVAATTLVAAGLVLGTGAASASADVGAACTQVWQYQVTTYGDMTNAESGGSFVGWAAQNDTLNVRIKGNPRYYGANVNNGKWGWVLASKLQYTGNTWCA
ncbi:hypothetical protein [Saccharothrix xinjiangensis]|uniref:SH3 domain-containing protein n=1 Tax=Saccharothrix xinjiangensis TaxID=204798 RepID=A0ABV9XWN7_9PSEU